MLSLHEILWICSQGYSNNISQTKSVRLILKLNLKMKLFLILPAVLIITSDVGYALTQIFNPFNHGHKVEQGCKTRFETKFEIQEDENIRTECDSFVE